MAIFSSFDFWVPLLIVAVLAAAFFGGFRVRIFLLVLAVSVGVCDGVVSKTLKRVVNRPRPAQTLGGVRQVDLARARPRFLAAWRPLVVRTEARPAGGAAGRSFPSSHVANMMTAALVMLLFFPRRGWLALPVAGLVGYSRVYTGAHWPSDVVASLFLGAGLGTLAVLAAELAWRSGAPRWWPAAGRLHPSLLAA